MQSQGTSACLDQVTNHRSEHRVGARLHRYMQVLEDVGSLEDLNKQCEDDDGLRRQLNAVLQVPSLLHRCEPACRAGLSCPA